MPGKVERKVNLAETKLKEGTCQKKRSSGIRVRFSEDFSENYLVTGNHFFPHNYNSHEHVFNVLIIL